MAAWRLRPEDVRAEDARRVLDALNAATSADELARAIEIPGEPDVGRRLAQRILARRGELGGFTELAQLLSVPLIGPERFTDIVVALSDARPSGDAVDLGRLEARIAALEASLRASGGGSEGRSLDLRRLQERPWLGQPVNLVATYVGEPSGRPRVGYPVTLATTWGRLRARNGIRIVEGNAVTTETDAAGSARALLLPPAFEGLLEVEQASLEAALAALPSNASSPADARGALRDLASAYRLGGNDALRGAIDAYVRTFAGHLLERIGAGADFGVWSVVEATVFACGQDAPPTALRSGAVQAVTVLRVPFVNWLGPWLQLLLALADEETGLRAELERARDASAGPGVIAAGIYARLRDSIDDQVGFVGRVVGREVAERSLRGFLDQGIAELPLDTRRSLFPALHAAARAVRSGEAGAVAAVGTARSDLRRDIGSTVADLRRTDLAPLADRMGTVEATIDAKVDTADFTAFRDRVASDLDTKVDASTFATFRDQTEAKLEAKVDASTFRAFRQDVETRLDRTATVTETAGLRTELEALSADARQIKTRMDDLQGKLRTVGGQIDTLRELSEDNARQIAGKVDQATFRSLRDDIERRFDGVVTPEAFEALRTELNQIGAGSRNLESTVAALKERTEALDEQVTAARQLSEGIRADLGQTVSTDTFASFQSAIQQRVRTLETEGLQNLQREVADLKRDSASVAADVKMLGRNLTTFNRDLGLLKQRVDRL